MYAADNSNQCPVCETPIPYARDHCPDHRDPAPPQRMWHTMQRHELAPAWMDSSDSHDERTAICAFEDCEDPSTQDSPFCHVHRDSDFLTYGW